MNELLPILAALAGGILPALAWLWFWRREDSKHPEPRRLIALAFLAGMFAVALVIPLEKYVQPYFSADTFAGWSLYLSAGQTGMVFVFIAWSWIEEIMKYVVAYVTVLRRKEDDEPIDPVIYMVTTALGFAAAENVLFLISPLSGSNVLQSIMTGNLRFIGATLLHVLSSSVIGVALGLSFYKPKRIKRYYTIVGVILAAVLHSIFNFLILNTPDGEILRTFMYVWIGLIILLAVLEYIKRIRPQYR